MNSNSQQKVIKAGFTIIRKDDYPGPRIKFIDKTTKSWKTMHKFSTKVERDNQFQAILSCDPLVIED